MSTFYLLHFYLFCSGQLIVKDIKHLGLRDLFFMKMVLKAKKETPDTHTPPLQNQSQSSLWRLRSWCWKAFTAMEIQSHSVFCGTSPWDCSGSPRTLGRALHREADSTTTTSSSSPSTETMMKNIEDNTLGQGQHSLLAWWREVCPRTNSWLACFGHCWPLWHCLNWAQLAGSKYINLSHHPKWRKRRKNLTRPTTSIPDVT